MLSQSIVDRFWTKVDRADTGSCWTWGGCRVKGYGQFSLGKARRVYAHRFAYELAYGPIPQGMLVLHRCDNPPCVRLDHLFLGTDLDNMQDKAAKGRAATGARNGVHTHPERVSRGEAHHRARMTAAQVLEAQQRRARGEKVVSIAHDLGVSLSGLYQALGGNSWRHLA